MHDWQPLRDSSPPSIRALPGNGPRGAPLELRYRLREETALARVVGEIDMGDGGVGFGPGRASGGVVRTRPPRVHVVTVPYSDLTFRLPGEPERVPPSRVRFCLAAVDSLGNASRVSCSTYRFR